MWGVTVGRQESSRAGCEQRETIVHLQGALSALMWWGTAPVVVPHVGLSDCLSENVMLMCLAEVSMGAVAQLSHSTGWGKSRMFLVTIWDGLKCPLGMCLPHLQCCHGKSFIPSSSPSCISTWHELSIWCIKVQEKGRWWTFYFVRVIFIFFLQFFVLFFFSEVIFGVRFTFCFLFLSVAFLPLVRGWCGLFISCDLALPWIQTVAFRKFRSSRSFQAFQHLPGASAANSFCKALPDWWFLLVSCFLIDWLVMLGGVGGNFCWFFILHIAPSLFCNQVM